MKKNNSNSENQYIFKKEYESSFISDVITTYNSFSENDVNNQIAAIKNIIEFIKIEQKKGTSLQDIYNRVFFNLSNIFEYIRYPNITNFYELRTIESLKGIDLKPYLEEIIKSKINIIEFIKKNHGKYSANIKNNIILELCELINEIIKLKDLCTYEDIHILYNKVMNNQLEMSDLELLNRNLQRCIKDLEIDKLQYWENLKKNPDLCRRLLYKLKDRIFEVKTTSSNEQEHIQGNLSKQEIQNEINKTQDCFDKSRSVLSCLGDTINVGKQIVTVRPLTKSPFIGNDEKENFIIIMNDLFRDFDQVTLSLLYEIIMLSENETNKENKEIFRSCIKEILSQGSYRKGIIHIRDYLLTRLGVLMSFYLATGNLETFCDKNNERLKKAHLGELKIDLETLYKKFLPEYDANGIYFFEQDKMYDKLCKGSSVDCISDEALVAMSATYVNRMAKIMPSYKILGYILEKKGVIEKIYNNPELEYDDLGYTEQDIMTYMAMYKVLQDKIIQLSFKRDSKGNQQYKGLSCEETIKKLNKYKNVYDNYFKDMGFDFQRDIYFTMLDGKLVDEMYKLKSFSVKSLLYTAITDRNKNIINWGVVPDDDNNNSNFILLAFDIKFLNMPIFLHTRKEELIDFVKELTGDTRLQVYEGAGDMYNIYVGHRMTTQVVYPVSKSEKKQMLKLSGVGADTRFFKHIKWMQQPNKEQPFMRSPGSRMYNLENNEINAVGNNKKSQPDASAR